jgi:hypothetical protein
LFFNGDWGLGVLEPQLQYPVQNWVVAWSHVAAISLELDGGPAKKSAFRTKIPVAIANTGYRKGLLYQENYRHQKTYTEH